MISGHLYTIGRPTSALTFDLQIKYLPHANPPPPPCQALHHRTCSTDLRSAKKDMGGSLAASAQTNRCAAVIVRLSGLCLSFPPLTETLAGVGGDHEPGGLAHGTRSRGGRLCATCWTGLDAGIQTEAH